MANEFDEDFGDFEQTEQGSEQLNQEQSPEQQPLGRVRIPRNKEVLGKVDQRVGANRMIISCFDGKQRNCRVPGRLKRALWIRPGNIVLVEPWQFEGDKKGDIIFSYKPNQVEWLQHKGFLKDIGNEF